MVKEAKYSSKSSAWEDTKYLARALFGEPRVEEMEDYKGFNRSVLDSYFDKDFRGFSYAGLGNTVKQDSRGVLLSNGENVVGGDANGVISAILTNLVYGNVNGVTNSLYNNIKGDSSGVTTGGANVVRGEARGIVSSALFNNISGNLKGVASSLSNYVNKNLRGVAVGGFNVIGGDSSGLLLSLLGNYTGGDQNGNAFSVAQNHTKGVMRGLQSALLLNVCGEGSAGTQLGLINYRRGGDWRTRFIPFLAVRTGKSDSRPSDLEEVIGNEPESFEEASRRLAEVVYPEDQIEAPPILPGIEGEESMEEKIRRERREESRERAERIRNGEPASQVYADVPLEDEVESSYQEGLPPIGLRRAEGGSALEALDEDIESLRGLEADYKAEAEKHQRLESQVKESLDRVSGSYEDSQERDGRMRDILSELTSPPYEELEDESSRVLIEATTTNKRVEETLAGIPPYPEDEEISVRAPEPQAIRLKKPIVPSPYSPPNTASEDSGPNRGN